MFFSQAVRFSPRRFPSRRGGRQRNGHASVRNRVHGRERDHSDRAHVQPRQPRAPDMRVVRPVPSGSAAERAHLGGAELAPEEDVPHTAARLDGRRQAPRAARRGKSLQVRTGPSGFFRFSFPTPPSPRPIHLHGRFYRFFTQLPSNYYLEITQMLLSVASEDIPQGNEIKTAVKVSASPFRI